MNKSIHASSASARRNQEKVFQVLADHPELVEGGLQLLIDATTGRVGESKRFTIRKNGAGEGC